MNEVLRSILQSKLEAYLAEQPATGADPRIESFELIESRALEDTYAFTFVFDDPDGPATQRLVLKTFPNSPEGIDRALKERHALFNLRAARYPVPGVMSVEIDPEPLGSPFLIREYIEGQPLYDVLVHADERARRDLVAQFVSLIVDLHERGPQVLVKQLPAASPFVLVNREVHVLRGLAEKRGQSEFAPAIDWLYENRKSVPCQMPVVTNRGFTPADVLVSPNGRMYVQNWGWQISDARYDLAWTLLDLQRGELADLRADILAEYQRVTGANVENLEYFEVLAATRWLMDRAYESRQRGDSALGSDPFKTELFAQMRQATQQIAARSGVDLPDAETLIA